MTNPMRRDGESGQSLIETAIMMPMVLTIAFNAINIGYFWFIVLQLSAVPRLGVEYATQGGAALTTSSKAPSADAVSDLVYENLQHTINATVSNASAQVCSVSTTTASDATCTPYGPSATFPTMTTDSEAPLFTRKRVVVVYTVTPLIPGTIFNVSLPSTLIFKRQVTMRSLYF